MAGKGSESFTSRPAILDDAEAVAELLNLCAIERTGEPRILAREQRSDWQAPGFLLDSDTLLVFAPDEQLAGYATLWDNEPHIRLVASAEVHPDFRGQGVGTALCRWIEDRARQALPLAPPGERVVLAQERLSIDHAARALLEAQGYHAVRHSYRMVIEMKEPPPEPDPIPGITLRPFIRGQEERDVVQTIVDAFQGHYGYVTGPFEEEYKHWLHYFDSAPGADPSLWFVAVEGEHSPTSRIVGTIFCHPEAASDLDMAWIFALAVRQPWRKRGLGLALLRHAVSALYSHSKSKACLNVDAQNASGATRLYEKAGLRIQRQYTHFEKELHPGTHPVLP